MWDIFGVENVPFDGVLVSLATLQQSRSKYQEILDNGIHKFLGLPHQFSIMADCGAFSYIKENEPPYKTENVLKIYSDMGFNYGVSIDHLVVPAFKEQNKERMRITYENGVQAYQGLEKKIPPGLSDSLLPFRVQKLQTIYECITIFSYGESDILHLEVLFGPRHRLSHN